MSQGFEPPRRLQVQNQQIGDDPAACAALQRQCAESELLLCCESLLHLHLESQPLQARSYVSDRANLTPTCVTQCPLPISCDTCHSQPGAVLWTGYTDRFERTNLCDSQQANDIFPSHAPF